MGLNVRTRATARIVEEAMQCYRDWKNTHCERLRMRPNRLFQQIKLRTWMHMFVLSCFTFRLGRLASEPYALGLTEGRKKEIVPRPEPEIIPTDA
eukprot:1231821-Pyramimonas_sp.AAC.1